MTRETYREIEKTVLLMDKHEQLRKLDARDKVETFAHLMESERCNIYNAKQLGELYGNTPDEYIEFLEFYLLFMIDRTHCLERQTDNLENLTSNLIAQ